MYIHKFIFIGNPSLPLFILHKLQEKECLKRSTYSSKMEIYIEKGEVSIK